MWRGALMPRHVCKVRRQLVGTSLLHYVGLRDGAQVTRLGSKCLYPLGHLHALVRLSSTKQK